MCRCARVYSNLSFSRTTDGDWSESSNILGVRMPQCARNKRALSMSTTQGGIWRSGGGGGSESFAVRSLCLSISCLTNT